MREIHIDSPGAGDWIMERAGGYFREGVNHSFSTHRDGDILGGFALVGYTGAAMTMHMASRDKRWFSRDLAALAFGYGFHQLGCRKLLAPVKSTNHALVALVRRGGWKFDAVLRDVYPDADMIVFSMTRNECPWLRHRLRIREVA
jgi:RimJ/RimL family protein N-acetyltransferase